MSLKEKLLYELELNRDKDISGQLLAEKFGVTRNSVWKAINTLKKDGYEIKSSTNCGYRLSKANDLISKEGIESCLDKKYRTLSIIMCDTVDSTNNEAKRILLSSSEKEFLVIANEQTKGMGRRGKSFYSPRNGVYMTLVIHPTVSISDSVCVTSAAAVAIIKAINSLTNQNPQIKWVNDIFINDKKLAGILTEAVSGIEDGNVSSILIGVGINFKSCKVPKELKDKIAFLDESSLTKNQLIAEITKNLLELTSDLHDLSFFDDYRRYSMVLGKTISFVKNEKKVKATAKEIDDSGTLIVELENGKIEKLRNCDISIKLT